MQGETTASLHNYPPPVDRLLTYGEAELVEPKNWPNYLELGLGPEHISELIRMATDEQLYEDTGEDDESLAVWAPVHAWRALGQLHAEAAIEPLISLFKTQEDNDWALEELPDVFGMIGPAALPALTTCIENSRDDAWPGIQAVSSVEKIGEYSPETRPACVELLSKQLERFEETDPELNAFLILSLTKLQATEAAPLMERAFEADRVDESIMGGWKDVQLDLGLLSPEEAVQMRAQRLAKWSLHSAPFDVEASSSKRHGRGEVHKKAKHKSKVAKQSRKKNRRR